jgi:hypothetical protein
VVSVLRVYTASACIVYAKYPLNSALYTVHNEYLLGCREGADKVHAALVELAEERIILRDLDGEALGVEHYTRRKRRLWLA